EQAVEALHPLRALEQHEEGQKRDRERPDDDRDHALRDRERRARKAEHLRRAALMDRVPDLLRQVVFGLEEAKSALAVADVVDVVGDLAYELAYLVNDRRHEQRSDRGESPEHEDVGDTGSEAAPADSMPLEELDLRVQ